MGGQLFSEAELYQKILHFAYEFGLGEGLNDEILSGSEPFETLEAISRSPFPVDFLNEMISPSPDAASAIEDVDCSGEGQTSFTSMLNLSPRYSAENIVARALPFAWHPAAIYQILLKAAYIGMETRSYKPLARFVEAFDTPAVHHLLDECADEERLESIIAMAADIAEYTGSKKPVEEAIRFVCQFEDEELADYACEGLSGVAYAAGKANLIYRAIKASDLYGDNETVKAFMEALYQATRDPEIGGIDIAREILDLLGVAEANIENPQYARDFFQSYAVNTEQIKEKLNTEE